MRTSRTGWTSKNADASRRRHCAQAFTLIELMVVVVIIAVLSAALVPAVVSASQRSGLRSAATQVADLLNFAYASAVARRHNVTVNLDTQSGKCWVSAERPALPWIEAAYEAEPRTIASIALPKGIELTIYRGEPRSTPTQTGGSWETVRFASDGTAEDLEIELAAEEGRVLTVRLFGATGLARVVREEG